ncbi:MAG: hypothetical protein ABI626_08110 [Sphingomicrobium sp.]
MSVVRNILLAACCAGLAACGKVSPLEPAPGQPLPVKPLLAKTTPTAEDLLTLPTNARPERVDELVRRSQPRVPDRFDLPPPDGGAAPVLPETEQPSSSDQTGVVTPQ